MYRLGIIATLLALLVAGRAEAALTSENLLVNGDAEQGPAATDVAVARPLVGWETFQDATAVLYDQGGFPAAGPQHGTAFFAGGPGLGVRFMTQDRFLAAETVEAIRAGNVTATVSGDFGGYLSDPDRAQLAVAFGTGPEDTPTTVQAGPVSSFERGGRTELQFRTSSLPLPPDVTYFRAQLIFTDGNGNYVDGYADNLSVTLSAPLDTEITGGPGVTNDATPRFTFRASPTGSATFLCGIDVDTPTLPCDTGEYTAATLADGEHTFVVAAARGAETDATPARRTFSVDTQAPALSIRLGPPEPAQPGVYPGPVQAEVVAGDGGSGLANVRCRIDPPAGDPLPTCALVGAPRTVSEPGAHRVVAAATDLAGNQADAEAAFVISTPPATTITSTRLGATRDTTPEFTFTADQDPVTFACRIDDAPFGPCDPVGPLGDGEHLFEVRATNADGVTGPPASERFTVDTVAPQTTITLAGEAPYTGPVAVTVTADDTGAQTRCAVDPATAPATFADLGDPCPGMVGGVGAHTVYAASRDAAGNTEPVRSRSFTIVAAPETTLDPLDGPTRDPAQPFTFRADVAGATFRCRVDDGPAYDCAPGQPTPQQTDGEHSFSVFAVADGVADPTPASAAYTVDTVAPTVAITLDPAAGDPHTSPVTVTVSASEAAIIRCAVDPSVPPAGFGDLTGACPGTIVADGHHTVHAAARDAAGNVSPLVQRSFEIRRPPPDTTPPTTTIDLSADGSDGKPVTVTVRASEPAEIRCALDPATAPASYADLSGRCRFDPIGLVSAPGPHTVYAASRDAAGNTEAPVVARSFTVAPAPDTTITFGPRPTTYRRAVQFEFEATVAGSVFECRVDGGAFAPCRTGVFTPSLADGPHVFAVRAIAPGGVADPTPATWNWTIPKPKTTTSACTYRMPWPGDVQDQGYRFENHFCRMAPVVCPPDAFCDYRAVMTTQDRDLGDVWYETAMAPWPGSAPGWHLFDPYCRSSTGGWPTLEPFRPHLLRTCAARFSDHGGAHSGASDRNCRGWHGDGIGPRPCNRHNLALACHMRAYVWFDVGFGYGGSRRGPDAQRYVHCEVTVTVSAPGPLAAVAGPGAIEVAAPGPGLLSARTFGAGGRTATIARTLLRPSRQRVKKAGPVKLRLKLTRTARRTLQRRGRLPLRLQLRFLGDGGTVFTRRTRVTLARPSRERHKGAPRCKAFEQVTGKGCPG